MLLVKSAADQALMSAQLVNQDFIYIMECVLPNALFLQQVQQTDASIHAQVPALVLSFCTGMVVARAVVLIHSTRFSILKIFANVYIHAGLGNICIGMVLVRRAAQAH